MNRSRLYVSEVPSANLKGCLYYQARMITTATNLFRNAMVAFFSMAVPQIILACAALGQGHATLSRPLHLHWFFEANDITNLTPAVGGEKIYIPLDGGNVVSLSAIDGSHAWKSDIGGVVSAAPVADTKGVYIASESFQIGRASCRKECRSRWAPDH